MFSSFTSLIKETEWVCLCACAFGLTRSAALCGFIEKLQEWSPTLQPESVHELEKYHIISHRQYLYRFCTCMFHQK